MTREDINKFWSEAYVNGMLPFEQREKFAALVAAAEREQCAKVCDVQIESGALSEIEKYRAGFIADVIRARGENK
jgi:hypothetical protein